MQRACNLPRDQDTRGQKVEDGVGGMPGILLCTVHAPGVKGGWGQGDRRPETLKPGKWGKRKAREDEHTRGRAGPGSGSREGERGGRVASQIAPHRAHAGRRAEAWRWRRGDRGMLYTDLMPIVRPGLNQRTGARTTKVPRNRAGHPRQAGALDTSGCRSVLPLGSPLPEVQCATCLRSFLQ